MKVCVLGAGVAGLASAHALAERGHRVTVLERRPGPALETSFANAGLLTPSQSLPWNEPGVPTKALGWLLRKEGPLVVRPRLDPALWGWLARFALGSRSSRFRRHALTTLGLARLSRRELDGLLARHDVPFDRTDRGVLTLVRGGDDRPGVAAAAARLRDLGIACREIGVAETLALEPALRPVADRFVGALLTPEDGSGDLRKFCLGLVRLGTAMGIDYRFDTTIGGLRRRGRRIEAARTDAGEVEADAFVLALGSASRRVAARVGIPLALYPVQGCSLTVTTGAWEGQPSMPVRDPRHRVAITPMGDRLRVAGMAVLNGGSTAIHPAWTEALRQAMRDVFPHAPMAEPAVWSGLRPMTPDGPPLLGPTPYANLWLNTGHGPLGWTLACGSARLVADLIDGRPLPLPLDGLTYDRFAFLRLR